MVDASLTPTEVYVYRFTLAYLVLLLFTFRKLRSNNLQDEFQFLLCGLCAGSLYFITENYALKNTTAGNVSLLASMSPIFTTLLIAIVYKARIQAGVVVGSSLAFAGVACIILSSGEGFEIHPKGDLLALSAALSWAVYSIAVKRLIPLYNSFFITRKIFFYGVITAIPLLIFQKEPLHIEALIDGNNPHFLFNFLFLVLFCSLAAYLLWNESMKSLGSVTSNNYLYLQPVTTLIAAYFVFGERINLLGYVGCFLIIGGLVIADKIKTLRLK